MSTSVGTKRERSWNEDDERSALKRQAEKITAEQYEAAKIQETDVLFVRDYIRVWKLWEDHAKTGQHRRGKSFSRALNTVGGDTGLQQEAYRFYRLHGDSGLNLMQLLAMDNAWSELVKDGAKSGNFTLLKRLQALQGDASRVIMLYEGYTSKK